MARGLMSIASPLGSALIDHQAGDAVTFKTPGGERQATVVSVT
jgi:transcription elongation GreA/GreB family factor